ncbi:hypothetical protein Q9L58_008587 [Maublancomyces gigas]|uniref:C2H2-type domain-containing protein n=1 Tax=Discina gigas TaxID=1032678 RepID=A0ABR3G9T6_9PEZI
MDPVPQPPLWTCATCNVLIPRPQYSWHMRSEAHLLRFREQNPSAHYPSMPAGPRDFVRNSEQQQQQQQQQQPYTGYPVVDPRVKRNAYAQRSDGWYCAVCELDMHVASKLSHLRGRPHTTQLVAKGLLRSVGGGGGGGGGGARRVEEGEMVGPRHNSFATRANNTWYCELCQIEMGISSKIPHLVGKPHAGKLALSGLGPPVGPAGAVPATAQAQAQAEVEVEVEAGMTMDMDMGEGEGEYAGEGEGEYAGEGEGEYAGEGEGEYAGEGEYVGEGEGEGEAQVQAQEQEAEVGGEVGAEYDYGEEYGGEVVEEVEEGGEEEEEEEGEGEEEEGADDEADENEDEYEEEMEGDWPPNDVGDWPEIPIQTTSSMSWRCSACDETMSVFFKEEHLSSKIHIRKAIGQFPSQQSWTTSEPTAPVSMTWQCTTCDETMSVFFKEEHLSGKRHLKTIRAQGSSQGSVTSRDVLESASSVYWTPEEQDIGAISGTGTGSVPSTTSRAPGFRPPMTLQRQQTPENRFPRAASSSGTRELIDISKEHTQYTSQPLLAAKIPLYTAGSSSYGFRPEDHVGEHVAATDDWSVEPQHNLLWGSTAAQWTCTVCSMTMSIGERDTHLASAGHLKRCNCSTCVHSRPGALKAPETKNETDYVGQPSDEQAEEPTETSPENPISAAPGMFDCRICNAEFPLDYRWMHLSRAWECTSCERWLHFDWKVVHLERHAQRANKFQYTAADQSITESSTLDESSMSSTPPNSSTPPSSAAAEELFYCADCNKDIKIQHQSLHQGGVWVCTICDKTVHIPGKATHLAGRKHNQKLEEQGQYYREQVETQTYESQFQQNLIFDEEQVVELVETQAYDPQFQENFFDEEQAAEPVELIDLLGDFLGDSIEGYPTISQWNNQSYTENDSWDLVFGAGAAATDPAGTHILDELREPESGSEDQSQTTNGFASALEEHPDHESTYGSQSTLQELEEIGDAESLGKEGGKGEVVPETPVLETFCCEVCGNRPYSVEMRKYHLGRPWECRVCNKTMHLGSRISHLAGKSHAKHELMESSRAYARTVAVAPIYAAAGSSTDTPAPACELPEETAVAAPSEVPEIPYVVPQAPASVESTLYCATCNKWFKKQHERIHKTRAWECTVCNVSMHLAWRTSHIAGGKHLKRQEMMHLRESAAVETTPAPTEPVGATPVVEIESAAPTPPRRKLPLWAKQLRKLHRIQDLHSAWVKDLKAEMPEIIAVYETPDAFNWAKTAWAGYLQRIKQ